MAKKSVKTLLFTKTLLSLSVAKAIALIGVFTALSVAVNIFSIDISPSLKVSFNYLFGFFCGAIFGPVVGFTICFTGDLLAFLTPIFSSGVYWLPTGICSGLLAFIPGLVFTACDYFGSSKSAAPRSEPAAPKAFDGVLRSVSAFALVPPTVKDKLCRLPEESVIIAALSKTCYACEKAAPARAAATRRYGKAFIKAAVSIALTYLTVTCFFGALSNYLYVKYVVFAGREYRKTFAAYLGAKILFSTIISAINYALIFALIPVFNSIKSVKFKIQ